MVCGLDLLRGARALRLPNTPTPFAIPSPASSSRVTLQAQPQQSSRFHSSARTLRAPVPHSPLVPRPQTGYPATASKASGGNSGKRPNAYTVWYREIFPSMIPIFVLSTAIFLALSLARTHLSHARSLEESGDRIAQLEAQVARLRAEAKRRQERERRERERILPLLVERVLQRVGAIGEEDEGEIEVEERLLV